MATHSSILAYRIPWTEGPVGYSPEGHKESDTTEATEHTCMHIPTGSTEGPETFFPSTGGFPREAKVCCGSQREQEH